MIYKCAILGATGRMGIEISNLLAQGFTTGQDYLELCDAVAGSNKITSVEGIPVRTLSALPREPAHIWIDFSRPEATLSLLGQIDTPIVIGTTGFVEEQRMAIQKYAESQAVLLAPNTSVGMYFFNEMLKCAPPPGLGFDVELSETHHRNKKDSPSGTAKSILDALAANGYTDPQVNVTRAGGVRGIHSVKFISDGEILELRHEVMDRKVFATGACLSALALLKKQEPGIYSMEDIFSKGKTDEYRN